MLTSYYNPNQLFILGHKGLFSEAPFPDNLQIILRAISECSVATTWKSVSRLLQRQQSKREVEAAKNILLEDGYIIYCDETRAMHSGTFNLSKVIKKKFEEARQGAEPGGPRKVYLDSGRRRQFEEFLALTRENGIEVKVVLLPLQPDWGRQMFRQESQEMHELKQYLQDTCMTLGATYRDFTDLHSFDGDPNEFYDHCHPTFNNTRRMMNALFGIDPRSSVAEIPADIDILNNLPAVTSLTKE